MTLNLPEELVEDARRVVKSQGQSLDGLVRAALERATGRSERVAMLAELQQLWAGGSGSSHGRRWTRDEIHGRMGFRRLQHSRQR